MTEPSDIAEAPPPAPPDPTFSGEECQLDPRVVTLWRLQRLLNVAIIGVPMAIGLGVAVSQVGPLWLAAGLSTAFLVFRLILVAVWPTLAWRAWRYRVREHDLLLQSGVLFRRWSSVPHTRIQHVDTRQGPIERWLGLSSLAVYTAAGMSADGSIPGLAEDEAARLRDALSRRGGDDGV